MVNAFVEELRVLLRSDHAVACLLILTRVPSAAAPPEWLLGSCANCSHTFRKMK